MAWWETWQHIKTDSGALISPHPSGSAPLATLSPQRKGLEGLVPRTLKPRSAQRATITSSLRGAFPLSLGSRCPTWVEGQGEGELFKIRGNNQLHPDTSKRRSSLRWRLSHLLKIGLLCWLSGGSGWATAGPWLTPGDVLLRHDVQLLSDAGVVRAPLTAWPIAWRDVIRDIDAHEGLLAPALADARARVLQHYRRASRTHAFQPQARVAGSQHPRQYRTFEATPRESGELEAGLEWTGTWAALSLQATVVDAPDDGKTFRYDGSHVAALWGNWALTAGAVERWWGPGWDGSLILSNNARPIPALSVQRHLSDPFETAWLSWMGPWQFQFTLGQLEGGRAVPDALFMGMRLHFRPTAALEIGLSRTAQWGGEGRPDGLDTFKDLLLGNDNRGANLSVADEPGNQLGGIDFRWQSPLFDAPYAVYGQFIGEDEAKGLPSRYIGLAGVETWGAWGEQGAAWRAHLEYADTASKFYAGEPLYNYAYEHGIYRDGYTYRDRIIGHALGGDGRMASLGFLYVNERGRTWDVLLRRIEPNRDDVASPTLVSAELTHRLQWRAHELGVRVGVVRRDKSGATNDQGQLDVQWQWRY